MRFNEVLLLASALVGASCLNFPAGVQTNPAVKVQQVPKFFDSETEDNASRMMKEGRQTFRFDTFGSEVFWGDQLSLHRALIGEKLGGVGPGVSPRQALKLGLKVDVDSVPSALVQIIKEQSVSLDDPKTTVALLRANAVVGVKGTFDSNGKMQSMELNAPYAIRQSMIPSQRELAAGSTAGRTAIWMLARLPLLRPTSASMQLAWESGKANSVMY
jgi:hypothetical protein